MLTLIIIRCVFEILTHKTYIKCSYVKRIQIPYYNTNMMVIYTINDEGLIKHFKESRIIFSFGEITDLN